MGFTFAFKISQCKNHRTFWDTLIEFNGLPLKILGGLPPASVERASALNPSEKSHLVLGHLKTKAEHTKLIPESPARHTYISEYILTVESSSDGRREVFWCL